MSGEVGHPRRIVMKSIVLASGALALVTLTHAGTAQAQRYTNYPYCAVYGLRTESCAFNTMQQCLMTVSGRGGFCQPNAFYEPPRAPRRRARG